MVFSNFLVAATCLASALAAPLVEHQALNGRDAVPRETQSLTAGLMAVRSASPIHFQTVNATGGAFWIFKETNAACPLQSPDCALFPNTTSVTIYNDSSAEYQAYMAASVPGGQNV